MWVAFWFCVPGTSLIPTKSWLWWQWCQFCYTVTWNISGYESSRVEVFKKGRWWGYYFGLGAGREGLLIEITWGTIQGRVWARPFWVEEAACGQDRGYWKVGILRNVKNWRVEREVENGVKRLLSMWSSFPLEWPTPTTISASTLTHYSDSNTETQIINHPGMNNLTSSFLGEFGRYFCMASYIFGPKLSTL